MKAPRVMKKPFPHSKFEKMYTTKYYVYFSRGYDSLGQKSRSTKNIIRGKPKSLEHLTVIRNYIPYDPKHLAW